VSGLLAAQTVINLTLGHPARCTNARFSPPAGGTMIYDKQAPAWWTLADPEVNEADVATSMRGDV
jgi:hypothetical protein